MNDARAISLRWACFVMLLMIWGGTAYGQETAYDKTAIGPFETYCDGYGMPGAQGLGYVSVLKVSTGITPKTNDALLDGIVAYDMAEAADAYIGQINMLDASSFNGLTGSIWGYDLAVAEEIHAGTQKPLFEVTQHDGSPLPVYDAAPLLQAGEALFGTKDARRFPPAPGAHVICANKMASAYRPESGSPDTDKGEAYGVWSYIAISLARDRTAAASLFIEDAGLWTQNDSDRDLAAFLDAHRRNVAQTIVDCGRNQNVVYDRTYIGYAYRIIPPGHLGAAVTVAPYVTLARKAVPDEGFDVLNRMTLKQWENSVGFGHAP